MTKRQWSLVVVLILVNWIIFSQLFQRIMNTNSTPVAIVVPTIVPTFTPSPVVEMPKVDAPTATLVPVNPTATNTPVLVSDEEKAAIAATETAQAAPPPEDTPTPKPVDTRPMVIANGGTVNLRSGPGTNYDKVGALQNGQSLEIVGRNNDSSWWQASTVNGFVWVAASVTGSENVDASIPVVDVPPPPATPPPAAAPTATPVPQPQYQYSITNLFASPQDNPNEGLTQIKGKIENTNGVSLRLKSGSLCIISKPTYDRGGPGYYDFMLSGGGIGARDGTWNIDVVGVLDNWSNANSDKNICNSLASLSEVKSVTTTLNESIWTLDWKRNW